MKNDKGFTLVEVLIYIALLGVIIIGFLNFMISISSLKDKVYVKQEVQANARNALGLIVETIKSANDVNMASSTFDLSPGLLSLEMDDSSENPTIISVNNDVLYIKKGEGSPVFITTENIEISNLIFKKLGNNSKENIRIEIDLKYRNDQDISFKYQTSLQTTVNLRQ